MILEELRKPRGFEGIGDDGREGVKLGPSLHCGKKP